MADGNFVFPESVSIHLKTWKYCVIYFSSTESSILCIRSLQRILQYHPVFKDVYREVGLLEVFVTCLHRFAALLKDPQADGGEYQFLIIVHSFAALLNDS